MRAAILLLGLLSLGLTLPSRAAEEPKKIPPASFTIVEPKKEYGLGDSLVLRLSPPEATIDPQKIVLLLNDEPTGLMPSWTRPNLTFKLQRIEAEGASQKSNRELWQKLMAEPYERVRENIPVALRHGDQTIGVVAQAGDTTSPPDRINLKKYENWEMVVGLLAVAVAVGGVLVFGKNSGMLRDAPVPQMPPTERTFSLGRCQMAMWFCLILTSFLLVLITLQDLNSINEQSFILLGISAATGLASVAIDSGRTDTAAAQAGLEALGLRTSDDVKMLQQAAAASQDAAIQERWKTYLQITKPYRSDGILKDLVTDAGGVTLHRFQIVIWTVVLGAIYAAQVYTSLKAPDFPTNLLIMMGITSGLYLGFKPGEKRG